MKVCIRLFAVGAASLLLAGSVSLASASVGTVPAITTRATKLSAMAVGMGTVMHMADYLKHYRGARSAIFAYFKMDDPRAADLIPNLANQALVQERLGREFSPQIALEMKSLSLAAFRTELATPGTVVSQNVRRLARAVAGFRKKRMPVFIRPFSEMNDATDFAPWEFGNRRYKNTPEQFAAAWKLLRETFDAEGATNAIFIFSPLAAHEVHRERKTKQALDLIPAGCIDSFGLNLYSRPSVAYGGKAVKPIAFADLALPWLRLLDATKHRGIPLSVSEMAVSNQATDRDRAEWLRQAFEFARSRKYVLVTYFNYEHRYWTIRANSAADAALTGELGAQ